MEHSPTECDGHGLAAHTMACPSDRGLGGVEDGGLRRLGGCPPRHGFSENTLPLEQRSLSLSDQDVGSIAKLLTLFHQVLRRLANLLRSPSYFGGKHGAVVQVGAGAPGQVATTPRA